MNHNMRLIYAMRHIAAGFIKIGISHDPQQRLETLMVTEKAKIEIIGVACGTMQHESLLHEKFAKSRFRGEWFHPTADVLHFVNSLHKYNNEWIDNAGSVRARIPGIEKFITWEIVLHNRQSDEQTILKAADLRKKRKALGWTQAQLAKKLGINHSMVSRMENEEIAINLRTLIALEAIFQEATNQQAPTQSVSTHSPTGS